MRRLMISANLAANITAIPVNTILIQIVAEMDDGIEIWRLADMPVGMKEAKCPM